MASTPSTFVTPGVYREDVFLAPAAEFRTGVPAFLGFVSPASPSPFLTPRAVTLWPHFAELFGPPLAEGFLAHAVHGFFDNRGTLCYVVALDETADSEDALEAGLKALAPLEEIDLVCVPDIPQSPAELAADLQQKVLDHCREAGDRFAVLDSLRGDSPKEVPDHRAKLAGTHGALYYPWIHVLDGPQTTGGFVPPCGHVAGIYARSDARFGVHKAPANEVLEGVLDLEVVLSDAEQGELNPLGINCLRAFPGRGLRVWGARTLADPERPEEKPWVYVNVRRLFLSVGRWIERHLTAVEFEPNEPTLWARIRRELSAYLRELQRRGAFQGATAAESFYVKCDAETNPDEVRDAGMVITEIGLAPAVPGEFIVVRIVHGAGGVTLSTTTETKEPDSPNDS